VANWELDEVVVMVAVVHEVEAKEEDVLPLLELAIIVEKSDT
jgi:hypothetical protein